MKRTVNTVPPSLCLREKAGLQEHWQRKKKKSNCAKKERGSSDPNAQRRTAYSNGEELGGCVRGVDNPVGDARIQETLPCSIDAFSCTTTFLSYSNQSLHTHRTTHTHTPHRATKKRNILQTNRTVGSSEREDTVQALLNFDH